MSIAERARLAESVAEKEAQEASEKKIQIQRILIWNKISGGQPAAVSFFLLN